MPTTAWIIPYQPPIRIFMPIFDALKIVSTALRDRFTLFQLSFKRIYRAFFLSPLETSTTLSAIQSTIVSTEFQVSIIFALWNISSTRESDAQGYNAHGGRLCLSLSALSESFRTRE